MPFDRTPCRLIRFPGVSGGLFGSERRKPVCGGDATRIDFANTHGFALRGDLDWFAAIGELDIDFPGRRGCIRFAPEKSGRGELRRKDGTILWIVNRYRSR